MKTAVDTSYSTVDLIRPIGQIPGPNKLHDVKQLAQELERPIREIRTLYQERKIPYYKFGHKSVRFDLRKVKAALAKFEVEAVSK
jgi:hypothetical protein